MKFETKFELGMRPWSVEYPYYRGGSPVCRIAQDARKIAEIAVMFVEDRVAETPYYRSGNGVLEPYDLPTFPMKEEAVAHVRDIYRKAIRNAKSDIEFFKKALEELE